MSEAKAKLSERFIALDDRLAGFGVKPLTAWWRDGAVAWLDRYEASGVLELWACAGRGAAKSTFLYKLALFFTLEGDFTIPEGERHFAIVLSRVKEEAAKGIEIIAQWLRKLGVLYDRVGDVIELRDMPRGLRVVSASVQAASGWRAYFIGSDERSKWAMGGVDELDAEEIDTSAAMMGATHANAPSVKVGSAWGMQGGFYVAITGGSDETRHVLGPAPTWIAAPHITEESTHRKERNPKRHAREFGSEFQSGMTGAFDAAAVKRAYNAPLPDPAIYTRCAPFFVLDPSGGQSDAYAYGVFAWYAADESDVLHPPKLVLEWCGGIERAAQRFTSAQMIANVCATARKYGCREIASDQFEKFSIASAIAASGPGITFTPYTWSAASKERAVELVRGWLMDDTLVARGWVKIRDELIAFTEVIAPSGALTFRAKRGRDDYAMLVCLAALHTISGRAPGSPLFAAQRRRDQNMRYGRILGFQSWPAFGSETCTELERLGYRPGSPQMIEGMRKLSAQLKAGVNFDDALDAALKAPYVAAAEARGFVPATDENPAGQAPTTGLTEDESAAWEWKRAHLNERDEGTVEIDAQGRTGDPRVWANREILGFGD